MFKSILTITIATTLLVSSAFAADCTMTKDDFKSIPPSPLKSDTKRALLCYNTSFDDIKKVEIFETDLQGSLLVLETSCENKVKFTSILSADLNKTEIPLSDWNGYTRKIVGSFDKKDLSLEYRDECSGGLSDIACQYE